MKHFMVCINPECEHPIHEVSAGGSLAAVLRGIPVIQSLNGDEPTLQDAIYVLEDLLESNPEDVLKDLVTQKLKTYQEQPSEESTETKSDLELEDLLAGASVTPVQVPADPDDYYRSPEYKAHRIRMDALEVKRVKAEIEYRQAETRLMNAKAQDLEHQLKLYGSTTNTPKTK